jgi:hypothetical protein
MSVIYESLKKLSPSGSRGAAARGKVKKGTGGIILKRSNSATQSMIGLVVLVVGAGFFGYSFKDELKGLGGTRFELPDKPVVVAKNVPKQTTKRPDLSDQPDTETQQSGTAGDLSTPASQYLPPEKTASVEKSPVAETAYNGSDENVEKPIPIEETDAQKAEAANPAATPDATPQVESTTSQYSAEDRRETKKPSQQTQEEKFLASLTREHHISQLIDKIKLSMASDNTEHTDKLFNRLERIKGASNSYVMKLKAFWYMQRGEFDLARPLLESVLSRNGDDKEAGVNMAVLEINSHQLPEARARLRKLMAAYPNDGAIHELYSQVK